ncbi:MAG TPA: alpha/beta fold hydrolase [Puia sp.]|jgi:pimeloyl-ACP methyl ester carboxylesterase
MQKHFSKFLIVIAIFISNTTSAQLMDSIVLKDIIWDKTAPAGMGELFIPSGGSLISGLIYKPNGTQKHPTLLLLHGYPGNERNLDLAQVVRAHGWNVIYFNYRGSWASQGQFSFANCVEDVKNVVAFCKAHADSLRIDTSNIVLFGHSMGGWICLKALSQLPGIKKGFALSTWNIGYDLKDIKTEEEMMKKAKTGSEYFVLNTSLKDIFLAVFNNRAYYDLNNDAAALANKQVIMLDEHNGNKQLAETIKSDNKSYFNYEVWTTDHPFTNKRVALMKKVLAFLDR